jgi:hypothetical protein
MTPTDATRATHDAAQRAAGQRLIYNGRDIVILTHASFDLGLLLCVRIIALVSSLTYRLLTSSLEDTGPVYALDTLN